MYVVIAPAVVWLQQYLSKVILSDAKRNPVTLVWHIADSTLHQQPHAIHLKSGDCHPDCAVATCTLPAGTMQ